jgi:hypothetical protein
MNRYNQHQVRDAPRADRVRALVALGGRRWQKGGRDRIYLPTCVSAPMVGLDVRFYESGNVSSAKLDGAKISNAEARRMLGDLDGTYYDVAADRFMGVYDENIAAAVDEWLAEHAPPLGTMEAPRGRAPVWSPAFGRQRR